MKSIKLIPVLVTVLLTLFSYSQSDNIEKYEGPIIDMHLHDYSEKSYFVAPGPGGMSPTTYQEYRKKVFELLKKHNVVHAVVSTIGGENKLDADGVLIPGYHTNRPPSDTTAFKQMIVDGKLKVFGEIGAVYAGLTLSHPGFDPYMKICERYGIPVAIHTGGGPPNITYRCCPNFRLELGDPYKIENVLAKYPKLKVYMMHAGEAFHEHAIRLMKQYSQLYADLGVILWVQAITKDYAEEFLKSAKKYGLIDRVMYGSDQMVWPQGIEMSIETLNSYNFLSQEDKAKIFYHNAAKFLELSDEEIKKHHKK